MSTSTGRVMAFWSKFKTVEYGLALGTVIFFVWSPLTLFFYGLLPETGLSASLGNRILVAFLSDAGLIVCLALTGLLTGFMLTSGRWTVPLVAGGLAWTFRVAVFWLSGNPAPPWQGAPEVIVHLLTFALAVGAAALLFGRVVHRGPRRPGQDPGRPGRGQGKKKNRENKPLPEERAEDGPPAST